MVEIKSLASPRVAFPIIGIIVLVVVSTLVAIFYIRNPGITDSIFGNGTAEETTPATFSMQSADGEIDHLHSSSSLQTAHQTTTATTSHDLETTTSSSPVTQSSPHVTQRIQQLSTQPHPIEPTLHLK